MTNKNKTVLNLLMIEQMLGEATADLIDGLNGDVDVTIQENINGQILCREATRTEELEAVIRNMILLINDDIAPLFISNEVEGQ
ncbi:hypothetical protein [Macrococcoides caseolyticum]|uniref:hypothetical protein n=1 Tax=Macrococcoides caseolyticum TaxID=69966 RepID=UPI000C337C94|nr:hypothetical protein [Macrococcus caseolyticus]PKF05837.1 hypothetical protein CW698_09245 [Macrococcus caseolyticus]